MVDVLIVDDDEDIANLIRSHLDGHSVSSEVCYSFSQAMTKHPNRYKILLADLNLGGSNTGEDLVRSFKKESSLIKTILYTASGMEVVSNADLFYSKGTWSIEHLIGIIEGLCVDNVLISDDTNIRVILEDIALLKKDVKKHEDCIMGLEKNYALMNQSVSNITKDITEIKKDVKDFIEKHQLDWIKIVGAIGILLGICTALLKLLKVLDV